VAGLVLAGGESRRMGSPKALLDWRGEPLLAHVCAVVGEVADPVIAVAAADQELPSLPGVRVARDRRPGLGPLEALAAGLAALPHHIPAALVCPVDVPLLEPATLRGLTAALEPDDLAVATAEGGRVRPLPGVYRVTLADVAERLLAGGERRLGAVLAEGTTRILAVSDLPQPGSLENVNTPEELEAARRR
jgi:molybdopterin-guanine dinucleotide biosynthesis protein A